MNMTEAETRQRLINEKLRLAGWNINDPSQVTEELDIDLSAAGIPRVAEAASPYAGHRYADYALLQHGKPIAVVEAKKTSKSAALGQEQALQYALNLQKIHGGAVPFISYTNGYDIYFWEYGFYPPVKVFGFPTRDDLEWLSQRRENRRPLSVEMINTSIVERDYQIAAIRSVLEGIEQKKTKSLLVMATGTGKTRTAAALIGVLIRARWARRVLFLVDRIALQEQALDAFKEHIPHEPRWPKEGERVFVKDRRLYVSTYPTMLNLIQNGTSSGNWITPHFFDVIIADESHRSIYNLYKDVLNYFNAQKLGLTATPTKHIDHDTFELFNCDTGDPTFAYTYEEATTHKPPYLNDYGVLSVRSKFQIGGIKGKELSPADQKRLIAEGIDIEEIDFEGTDLERKVTNAGTNALIVREFMDECIKDHTGTLPGKSIIFAISKSHARRLQDLFDKMYPEHVGKLARVLVSEDRYVYGKGGLLDQFKTQDMPRVAISVDMLDTGVDVPEVVNLVFAKPVFSYVKFWQMIGRGTRILNPDTSKRKPWCTEKDKFLIIDCWANFEYFKMHPKGIEPDQLIPLPVVLFRSRLEKLRAAFSVGESSIVQTVKHDLQADIDKLPKNNVSVLEKQAELAVTGAPEYWDRLEVNGVSYLNITIAPILRVRSDVDFKAMRFEISVVDLGTAQIQKNEESSKAIRESIVEQVSELPLSVNVVAKERDFIESVLRDQWWNNLTEEKFCELIQRLAPLMKYRRRQTDPILHLNLEDLLASKEWIEFGPEHERMTTNAYREKVEAYIQSLVGSNMALQKLKDGKEVSDVEVVALANLLHEQDPFVTEELLRKVYDHKSARFIQFIRHILGLEKLTSWSETVTAAFDSFIAGHTNLTVLQIQFLQMVKTFVLQTGKVERQNLVDAPFTQIHPQGVRGIFRPREIEELIKFTEDLVA